MTITLQYTRARNMHGRHHQDTTAMSPCHSHHHFKITKRWPRRRQGQGEKRDTDDDDDDDRGSRRSSRYVFYHVFYYYYTNIIYKYDNGTTPHSINAREAIKGPMKKDPNDVLSSFGP